MSTVNNMQIQDNEGNVFHPETSIEQIVGENGTQVFPGGKPGNMESSDMTAAFDEVKMRENIKSGEKHRVLFGKIQKFFADLKTVAFSGKYGDLSERPTLGGAAGYKVADNDTTNNSEFLTTARVAYEHGQEIDALSRDLGGLAFAQDTEGNWGYKIGGADTVTPFKSGITLVGSYPYTTKKGYPNNATHVFTVNATKIAGYKKMTEKNFIVETLRAFSGNSGPYNPQVQWTEVSVSKSYDSNNGILTVTATFREARNGIAETRYEANVYC